MLHWIEIEQGRRWHLIRGQMAIQLGAVQCFYEGAYYGTWEAAPGAEGGRTGSMCSLEECKAAVERKVQRAAL